MPCHHVQHARNVGPNLFAHNKNSTVMSCSHRAHAGKPAALCIHGMPEITYGDAMHTSQMIFNKTNCLTF